MVILYIQRVPAPKYSIYSSDYELWIDEKKIIQLPNLSDEIQYVVEPGIHKIQVKKWPMSSEMLEVDFSSRDSRKLKIETKVDFNKSYLWASLGVAAYYFLHFFTKGFGPYKDSPVIALALIFLGLGIQFFEMKFKKLIYISIE